MVRALVSLTWARPLTCTKVTALQGNRANLAMVTATPATSRDLAMEVQEVPTIHGVTMGLDLEASTLAMDRPLQASLASIPPAMPPPRQGPRPLVSPSCLLVTPDIGWRGQEERPLATGPGPLTQEAQEVQDTGPMAPATMGPATLLATPLHLDSIQEAPQEVTVDPLDTAQRGTVITIPLVTDRSSLRMLRPRALMASLCTMRQASSRPCPSHQTTQGADKLPRGTMAR